MRLVNSLGGHSIGVFDPETQDKTKVYKMIRDNRIKFFAAADYNEDTEIDLLVKAIIDRTAVKVNSTRFQCGLPNVNLTVYIY